HVRRSDIGDQYRDSMSCGSSAQNTPSQRTDTIRVAEQKRSEAERQREVIQGSAEVLPEGRLRSGVVRRKQQREHEEKPEQARRAHQRAERNAQSGKYPGVPVR